MMREIKFRAWDLGEMLYDPITMLVESATLNTQLAAYQADSSALMQYTGLKDKNGKEIYEGDIVKFQLIAKPAETYEVRWGHFGFTYWSKRTPDGNHYLQTDYVEVIGNIHENPELTTEGND